MLLETLLLPWRGDSIELVTKIIKRWYLCENSSAGLAGVVLLNLKDPVKYRLVSKSLLNFSDHLYVPPYRCYVYKCSESTIKFS